MKVKPNYSIPILFLMAIAGLGALAAAQNMSITESQIERLEVDYPAEVVSDNTAKAWAKEVLDPADSTQNVALVAIHAYSLLPSTGGELTDAIDVSQSGVANATVYLFHDSASSREMESAHAQFEVVKTNENGNAYFKIPLESDSENVTIVIKHPQFYTVSLEEVLRSHRTLNASMALKPRSNVLDSPKGFQGVKYECYDGTKDTIQVLQCTDAKELKKRILSICENRCKKTAQTDTEAFVDGKVEYENKCGVNSFQLLGECKFENRFPAPDVVPQFEWNETVSKELVYKLINRVAELESQIVQLQERISRLERLMNVDYYQRPTETQNPQNEKPSMQKNPSVGITNVRPEVLQTTAASIEPALENSSVEVQDGVPFVVNKDRSVKEEIPIEEVRNYAEKKISEDCGLNCVASAKDYKIKASVDETGKESYVVSVAVPNSFPVLNWFVPTETKTYSIPPEELERIKENRLEKPSFVRELRVDPLLSSYVKESK